MIKGHSLIFAISHFSFIEYQNRDINLTEKKQHLEEQLESLQTISEQCAASERIAGYMREIEDK